MGMFAYSDTNKRYHSLTFQRKQQYHQKVAKICLNAGYTCINRDGTKGYGGCHFCADNSRNNKTLEQQIVEQQALIRRKWPTAKFQLYWQAGSNTYGPLRQNIENYQLFRRLNDVVAIAIATRVDCLADDTLAYLDSLTKEIDVTIELGLQTMHDQTRAALNCQYSLADFEACLNRIAQTSCCVVVHIINSLPGETLEMMLATAQFLGRRPISGIKIQMLHIDRGTVLAQQYQQQAFPLLSLDQYTDLVIEQLRRLPPQIVIHRLTGDSCPADLIAPPWTANKIAVLNMIDKKMSALNVYQGDLCEIINCYN